MTGEEEYKIGDGRAADLEVEHCLRCFKLFSDLSGSRYCSIECEQGITPQAPFEVLYRQLHPLWPQVRGTNSELWRSA